MVVISYLTIEILAGVSKRIMTKSIQHRKRFVASTVQNPAGNVLPYFSIFGTQRKPSSSKTIKENLLNRLPIPIHDRIFGVKYGARETIPVDNVPDKAGFMNYLFGKMTSCKEDRHECLAHPNIAISANSFKSSL